MLSYKPFQILVIVVQLEVYHLDFEVIGPNDQITPRKCCGHPSGVTRQHFPLLTRRCLTRGPLWPGTNELSLLTQEHPSLDNQSQCPITWAGSPNPTCCLYLIRNTAEESSMFLEERLEKRRNNIEKSEKKRSRRWKGQARRAQEESQGVPSKQNRLRPNNWAPLNCWQQPEIPFFAFLLLLWIYALSWLSNLKHFHCQIALSMPNETRDFNPYLTQRSHGSEWLGDLPKVVQLMRGISNWPQATWFPNMFPQFSTRSIYFIFLCAVVCPIMGSLVTSKTLGYKRQEINSSMPLERL